jgi:hypothetical protein
LTHRTALLIILTAGVEKRGALPSLSIFFCDIHQLHPPRGQQSGRISVCTSAQIKRPSAFVHEQMSSGVGFNASCHDNGTHAPWFFANVFRQNTISGIVDTANVESNDAGFVIETNAGGPTTADPTAPVNPIQLFMNIMDSNIIIGATDAFRFISTTASGPGGVSDTVLWNNFALSDGVGSSIVISLNSSDTDPQPFLDEITNLWQNFDEIATALQTRIPPP